MPIDNPMPGFQPQPSTAPSSGSTVFTPAPSPSRKLPTKNILLAGVMILVLAGLVLGFGKARSFLSKAETTCMPSAVMEKNITPNSADISFQTEKACLMEVNYGTSSEAMLLKIPENTAVLNHNIKLSPLLPSTTYYYQIWNDGKKVGEARSFLTGLAANTAPTAPTAAPPVEQPVLTFDNFAKHYGTTDAAFDFDKNGIVNSSDWAAYQKGLH